ncbi:cytochrome b/b6 domain-containing protein [Sediminicoccus sp. KRV36]|uniref:cytochrome b n=1 Tax=Sediminicoccus sp. KRV36 TaxID=3133721 RepID=UPI002010038D|nr:cytochrome b/b6 domain-containing protein [Sediminicoccus rosea]UPY36845.1 cytochrome b/b6 domain-containing protein [Sediminicoccus rosea]
MAYTPLAKWFHWITVALILIALPTGFVIGHVKDSSKMGFYAIHESAGLTLLIVAGLRLWYRIRNPVPVEASLPAPMRMAATGVHHALYGALILQPLLGFFTTNAFGFPMQGATAYLGFINLPKFMPSWEGLANILLWMHQWLGLAIVALLAAHICAVIFHQAVRRDGTLIRMV